jgi:hypothetical protein
VGGSDVVCFDGSVSAFVWRNRESREQGVALMMEAARTSETLVNVYQTTRRYNLEDSHLRFETF